MRFLSAGVISAIRFNRTLLLTPPVVISRVSPRYYIHILSINNNNNNDKNICPLDIHLWITSINCLVIQTS